MTANPCNSPLVPSGNSLWYEVYPSAPVYASFEASPGDKVWVSVNEDSTSVQFNVTVTSPSGQRIGSLRPTQDIAAPNAQFNSGEWVVGPVSNGTKLMPVASFGQVLVGGTYTGDGRDSAQAVACPTPTQKTAPCTTGNVGDLAVGLQNITVQQAFMFSDTGSSASPSSIIGDHGSFSFLGTGADATTTTTTTATVTSTTTSTSTYTTTTTTILNSTKILTSTVTEGGTTTVTSTVTSTTTATVTQSASSTSSSVVSSSSSSSTLTTESAPEFPSGLLPYLLVGVMVVAIVVLQTFYKRDSRVFVNFSRYFCRSFSEGVRRASGKFRLVMCDFDF